MIKKKIKYLYKQVIKKIFIFLYGKVSYQKKTNSRLDLKSINSLVLKPKSNLKYKIYFIKNARIFTDKNENVAIIKNNIIVPEMSFQQSHGVLKNAKFNSVIKNGTTAFVKNIKGKVCNLNQGASGNNFFHFIFDIIPKIYILKSVINISKIDFFYVSNIKLWQLKIFKFVGIKDEKLLDSEKFNHIFANEIFSVEHPWYRKGKFQKQVKNIPKWIINTNRKIFLKKSLKVNFKKKIFLDRSSSNYNHCQIENINDIKKLLLQNNFEVLQAEKKKIQNQIHIFKNANIVIGAHGASFTNIIFCKPGTKIIEIIPTDHPNKKCETISKFLKLKYYRIKTKKNNFDRNYPFKIYLEKKHLKFIKKIIDL
tara:strand:+ start:109 stop:1209 length:1101 start_codon:yes stop_codon:yes gene_type:complete